MARRVGFGSGSHPQTGDQPAPEQEPPAPDAPRKGGPVARLIIIIFMLFWLGLWSYAIYGAWGAVSHLLDQTGWETFDYVFFGFYAIWLTGALVGWAFGVVILFLMLFGKDVHRSPAEQAERLKRRMARRGRGRSGGST